MDNNQECFFSTQEKGEKVILLLRAHPIVLIPTFVITAIVFVVPIIAPAALSILRFDLSETLNGQQTLILVLFWYLLVFGYVFYRLIFYYFNTYLVTNERIIDFDFRGILHKETSYAKLNQIQDISPKIIGFFGTFFHFGNVYVQTAAEKPEFEFHNVSHPDTVAQVIHEQVRLEETEAPGEVK